MVNCDKSVHSIRSIKCEAFVKIQPKLFSDLKLLTKKENTLDVNII